MLGVGRVGSVRARVGRGTCGDDAQGFISKVKNVNTEVQLTCVGYA